MSRWMVAGTLVLAAGMVQGWPPAPADTLEGLVKTVAAVGPEGKGNEQATLAWKKLVASGTPALLPILKGMQDEKFRAANWLRPAFEAIASRALKEGKLPGGDLEKFVRHTANAGNARRLAYEWLVKADPTTPDRLLPGMVRDPSRELRRDAVERLVKTAAREKSKAAYEQALAGASDPDQVDAIAAALEKLGVKVDLPRHFGFVMKWQLIAPFDNTANSGWNTAYPPEKGVDLKASYKGKNGAEVKWASHETKDAHGVVDLNKVIKKYKGAVAYAYAVVESPSDQDVWLRGGCTTSIKMWVNGKLAFTRDEYHHGMSMDQHVAKARLNKGKNTILLKVCQNEQSEGWAQKWAFQLRLSDFAGSAAPFTQASGSVGASPPGSKEDKR